MRHYWTGAWAGPLLQLLLPAAWGVQVEWFKRHPHAESQPRKIENLPINFQASRHTSSVMTGLNLSLEHQLEDRSSVFLCRGQRKPAEVFNERRNLTFIHIPRCAGTSIEDCSNDDLVGWGSMDQNLHGIYTVKRGQRCFKQHVPPSVVPELYTDKVTFCVVRNPYERMISEYHFPLTKGFADRAKAGKCNAQGLNDFTIESLKAIMKQKDPYIHDCHLLPQTAYVYGWDANTSTVTREHTPWCKHKVRQEHLLDDFNQLMVEYGYKYRLTSMVNPNTFAGPYWNCTHVTPNDFGPEALSLINEVWKDDFELLNFTMLPVVQKDEEKPALVQEGRAPKEAASEAKPAAAKKAASNATTAQPKNLKKQAGKHKAAPAKKGAAKHPPKKAAGKGKPAPPKKEAAAQPPKRAASEAPPAKKQ